MTYIHGDAGGKNAAAITAAKPEGQRQDLEVLKSVASEAIQEYVTQITARDDERVPRNISVSPQTLLIYNSAQASGYNGKDFGSNGRIKNPQL